MSIYTYAENGNKKELAQLINDGVDINKPGTSNRSALHHAAMNGHTEIVAMLLGKGATVNCQTNRGATPLHYASRSDRIECVSLLLDHGADVNQVDSTNSTPLHSAIVYKSDKTALALINNYGADINAQNNDGSTPLHLAAQRGYREIIVALLEKGAKVEVRDHNGDTPFSLIPLTDTIDIISSSAKNTLANDISSLMYNSSSSSSSSSGSNTSTTETTTTTTTTATETAEATATTTTTTAEPNGESKMNIDQVKSEDETAVSNSGLFSDVTFIVESNKIPAHRCILSVRSEHFKRLLLKHKSEKELEIKDISFKVFQSILDWVYNESVSTFKVKEIVDLSFATQLLIAAIKYNIKALVQLCEQYLIETVTSTSISSIWQDLRSTEIKSNCPELAKRCAHLLCKNWNVVGIIKAIADMPRVDMIEMVNLLPIQPLQEPAAAAAAPAANATAASSSSTSSSSSSSTSNASSTPKGKTTSRTRAPTTPSSTATPTKSSTTTPTRSSTSSSKVPSSPPTGDSMDKKNLEICKNINSQIHRKKMAEIFHFAVDPIALNIPHYFDVIKHPMDLSLIQSKLDGGLYKSIKDFAADMRLMFDNAMLFNEEGSLIYRNTKKLMAEFNKIYWDHFPFEKSATPAAAAAAPTTSASTSSTPAKAPAPSPAEATESSDKKRKSMEPSKAAPSTSSNTPSGESSSKSSTSSSSASANNESASSKTNASSNNNDVKMTDTSPSLKKYTDKERKNLMEMINDLNEDQLTKILEIIEPKAIKKSDEGVEIDMYEVGDANLAQLEEFIFSCLKRQKV
ncbi:ankyrin repeat-containing protein [Heterostelium album PN500]|uniref:Ankyrin repeat-containing protein n=1 Tax=Heterostelium pallidum (strain ATCC 26659 / Pp 5 / PN500) TaxID=670386 RepID=D3B8B6_HETP5|nr:ankyrin repeat-containing protein [Heterostelium album PN500]EFA82284.1 ankyrin repeat-containing protein [Heterostelium album PN500]|eukprot:XP_020434401.1 ankyrin repeat-containing protein [Heterostelium album PN500]